jgi:undecaprenyl-diphosphatase
MEQLNQSLFLFLNSFSHVNSFLDGLIVFLAQYLIFIVILSVAFYIYFHRDPIRGIREVMVVVIAVVLAYATATLIKHFYLHDRPFVYFTYIHPLISPDSPHGSFPSGHATFSSALAVAFYYYHPRLGIVFLVAAFLIGLARIIAGVHWPLDIIAGLILGAVIACLVHFVVNKMILYDRFGLRILA